MPMIVLTNDDGFDAPGIRALHREISKIAEVIIIAPETEQSAMGHAITLSNPLKARKVVENGEFLGYAIKGTPADSVKLAITVLLDEPPELVISGINLGGNFGTCVIYSGTVSAATEATIMGVPAVAISLNTFVEPDFDPAADFIRKFTPLVLENGLPEGVALNINVPPVPADQIQGAVFTRQGKSRVIEEFEERKDPRNNTYYWLAGELRFDESEPGTDSEMLAENYIAITPIHYDLTNFTALESLKQWKLDF